MTDTLVTNNARYAADFVPSESAPTVAVIACMDARLDVYSALGLQPGQAHVLRNAGGIVTDDVIRSLAISQRLLGTTEVMVVHHTKCGMLTFTDEEFATAIRDETGIAPPWSPGAFTDLLGDVMESVTHIANSPYLPHRDQVRGFVYDVDTGRLSEVRLAG